ncbi:hypothetical protein ACFQ1M_17360 [Sungkyunkwania multivorans]|uniref:Lipoprotein n=1 Tax=Sungkyunkwania multivorans TaxID=1173618 RepID=A0ABW3D614_9FLAO
MKRYMILMLAALLSTSCNSQEKMNGDVVDKDAASKDTEVPKGSWTVNKEFDENGNLIRYDSIYTWSSEKHSNDMASLNKDSLLRSMESRFYRNFSAFDFNKEGFGDLFAEDSLFTKRFFSDDFFESRFEEDFMDIDKMRERMEAMQKRFLERYRKEIDAPEDDKQKKK